MARSEFTYPLLNQRVFSPRMSSIRRRPAPSSPSTTMTPTSLANILNVNPSRSRPSRPSSPRHAVSSKVRRSLFGASNPEDTENLFNFVLEDGCENFRKSWGFDVKADQPCADSAIRWEKVDQDVFTDAIAKTITVASPRSPKKVQLLRPIRYVLFFAST
jgi:hypothetical protein